MIITNYPQKIIKTGIFLIFILLILFSCRKDDEIDTNPSLKLEFSTDSIIFDTVFSTVGSTTKHLMVYNTNKNKINISSIQLAGGSNSPYRINIDGSPAVTLNNIEIAGNDSLYVFIKVTVDPTNQNSPLVIKDSIIFETNSNIQDIDLIAWGQDAYYFIADTYVQGLPPYIIVAHENSDTTWDSQKPYLIYGYAVVDSTAILRIDAGANIHFHNNSGLWVYKGGSIKVNGTLDFPVTFQGDRLEQYYKDIPGQWDRIWLNEGSIDNEFNYAVIKNGYIGIQAETMVNDMGNQLILKNTIIKNMSRWGIFTKFYKITAINNVIANCAENTLFLSTGGNYDFRQCTFANYWNNSVRQDPSFIISNYIILIDNNGNAITYLGDLSKAYFGNCIIYGNLDEEILLAEEQGVAFNYRFDHSLMKTQINISDPTYYLECKKNLDPKFIDYSINNYELDT
ncbi:MAG: hypothetical protein K8R58_06400, partial [Bacteroidales bacterium]|nr:hypothetical protein [Bacteroidales bacterium]